MMITEDQGYHQPDAGSERGLLLTVLAMVLLGVLGVFLISA